MKIKLLLALFILLNFKAFAQTKNNISVIYGLSSATVDIHGAIGDYGYNTKSGMVAGLTYSRDLTSHFSLQTGLLFINDNVQLTSIVGGQGEKISNGQVKLISIPLIAKLTFFKYLFVDGGFSLDEQTNYASGSAVDKQSGLGFELGVGGKYTFSRITVFINPCLHYYAITRSQNNLLDTGAKVGFGYNF